MRRFRQLNQAREQIPEFHGLRATEGKIDFAVGLVELVVCALRGNMGLKHFVLRTDLVWGFLNGLENASGEKRKNRRTEADNVTRGNKHGPPQHICIDLIQDVVFLGNASGVDHAADDDAVLFHAIQDDARVQRSAFYGGEQFVLRGGLQISAESNAAQVSVYEDGASAIVPREAEEASFTGC